MARHTWRVALLLGITFPACNGTTRNSWSNAGPNSTNATSSSDAEPFACSETTKLPDAAALPPGTSKRDAGVQPAPMASSPAISTQDASVNPTPDAAATANGSDGGTNGPLEFDAETPLVGAVLVEDRSNRLAGTLPSLHVTFAAALQLDGTTVASYANLDSAIEVVLQPRESQTGSVIIDGLEIAGQGDLGDDQKAALQQLARSSLGAAVIQVPMALGCQVSYSELTHERAALLLPWQLLLKYQPELANVYESEAQSDCKYFNPASPGPTGLLLDREWPFPRIFGFYPVEFADSSMTLMDGALYIVDDSFTASSGNCRSHCRGACGSDCTPNNCVSQGLADESTCEATGDISAAVTESVETLTCGVEKGCIDHDACYDACLEQYGCGVFATLGGACRRQCDFACISEYSLSVCSDWASGSSSTGTFSSFETFRDAKPETREVVPCSGECANGTCVPVCDSTTCPEGCCDENGRCRSVSYPTVDSLGECAGIHLDSVGQSIFAQGGYRAGPSVIQVDFLDKSNETSGPFVTSASVTSPPGTDYSFQASVALSSTAHPGRFLFEPTFEAHATNHASADTHAAGNYLFTVDLESQARVQATFSATLANGSNFVELSEWGTLRRLATLSFEQGSVDVVLALSPGKYQFSVRIDAGVCGPYSFPCPYQDLSANATIDLSVRQDR
jgi:hypothetical protein